MRAAAPRPTPQPRIAPTLLTRAPTGRPAAASPRRPAPPPAATGPGEVGLGHRLAAAALAVLAALGGGGIVEPGAAFGAPLATTPTSTTRPPSPPPLTLTATSGEYEAAAAARAAARRGEQGASTSGLPRSPTAAALASFDRGAYTADGWEAAQTIARYARFVDSIQAGEAGPGCEACEDYRAALERVWQTVSREFYGGGVGGGGGGGPGAAPFTQAAWAARLEPALRSAPGGLLRTQRDFEAAATAMVASLGDRYTAYLPAPAFRAALRRPTAGELPYLAAQVGSGPGIVLEAPPTVGTAAVNHAPGVPIAAVAAESAAEAAGVRPGDALVEADWYRVDRLSPPDARALLRGPAGSEVTLTILPKEAGGGGGGGRRGPRRPRGPVTLAVERRAIPQPPTKVSWGLTSPGPRGLPLGYVRVHYFAREATDALAAALLAGEARGVAGWVVDLRGNPGGVFEEGVASAGLLLPPGAPIARTLRADGQAAGSGGGGGADFVAGGLPAADFPATAAGQLTSLPVAVVVDAGSASAAEVFAGAVTGGARGGGGGNGGPAGTGAPAVLVGEGRTFGKGLVQYYFPTAVGGGTSLGGLKVTVARYLSPAPGRRAGGGGWADVQAEHGLAPGLACAPVAPGLLGAAVPHGPKDVGHTGPGEPDPAVDGCLASALRWLEGAA